MSETFEKDGKLWITFTDGKTEEAVRCSRCKRTQPISLGSCDFCDNMRDEARDMEDEFEEDEPEEEDEN